MNIYKFNDENYKTIWVVARSWTNAYAIMETAFPKFDVVAASNESINSVVIYEGHD